MQVAGRVVFAPLDTRLPGRTMAGGVFALQAVAMAILLPGSSMLAIGLFIVVFGASFGANTLARPSILAETFGATHYGRISSVMAIFLTLARTAAPVGAGILYDRSGGYGPVLWIGLLLAAGAAGVMVFARPDRGSTVAVHAR
jgi:predicted MFS family arabinose efflux permease